MALAEIAAGYGPQYLLASTHPTLSPGEVVCAKVLAFSWIATGHIAYVRAGELGFVGTDAGAGGHASGLFLLAAQLAACGLILMSRHVRAGSGALAALIAWTLLTNQPQFSNNRAYCAALLGVLALSGRIRGIPASRLQVALVYGAAGLDKLLNGDWRTGAMLRDLAAGLTRTGALWSPGGRAGAPLPLASFFHSSFERHAIAAPTLSWLVIGAELALCIGYSAGLPGTTWLVIAFHGSIFALTGSTFGMFLHAMLASTLLLPTTATWVQSKHAPLFCYTGAAVLTLL